MNFKVLRNEKKCIESIRIKAESLFNLCQFEHSLLLFHRGQGFCPESEDFRLGIQKCRKTIKDSVKDGSIFKRESAELLFKILRRTTEMRSSEITKFQFQGKSKKTLGFHGILNLIKKTEEETVDGSEAEAAESIVAANGGMEINEEDIIAKREGGLAETLKEKQKMALEFKEEKQRKNQAQARKAARETRVFAENARKMAAKGVKRARKRKYAVNDRLFEDKVYLAVLARGINLKQQHMGDSSVVSQISKHASEALDYLRAREDFWDQIEAAEVTSSDRVCESFRFLM